MSIKNVQLKATVPVHNGVQWDTRAATEQEIEDDACLWSVYIGEPGDFSWIADFADRSDAEYFTNHVCETWAAELIVGGA
jgi:hypothetical protein